MDTILEILLVLLAVAAVAAVIGAVILYRSLKGWLDLFRGEHKELRLKSIEPPKGYIFNRDATLTFEARDEDGSSKTVEKGIPIPPVQAWGWKVLGHVPGPIGRLVGKRELDRAIFKRGEKRDEKPGPEA